MSEARGRRDTAGEIASLAGEHREQLDLLAALSEAVGSDKGHEAVTEILDRLTAYTDVHFMSEQLLMRLHSYPDYRLHESEHDELVRRIGELRAEFETGDHTKTLAATNALFAWLVRHINGSDHQLETFLADKTPPNGEPVP